MESSSNEVICAQFFHLAKSSLYAVEIVRKLLSIAKQIRRMHSMSVAMRSDAETLLKHLEVAKGIVRQTNLDTYVEKFENTFLREFIEESSHMKSADVQHLLSSFIVQKDDTLDKLLPHAYYYVVFHSTKGDLSTFRHTWSGLESLHSHLSLQPTFFLTSFCKSKLTGSPFGEDEAQTVSSDSIIEYLENIIGPYKFYRNLRKINDLYVRIGQMFSHEQENHDLRLNLHFKYLPPEESGLFPTRDFTLYHAGLEVSPRQSQDRIVIFGNSKYCDIVLPNKKNRIEDIHSILYYHSYNQVFLFDTSLSGTTFLRLVPHKRIPLGNGLIIKLAHEIVFEIIDQRFPGLQANSNTIDVDEDLEGCVQLESILIIRHIHGPFANCEMKFRTNDKNYPHPLSEFMIGRGGSGHDPYVALPPDSGASRAHAAVYFQDNNWYIADIGSLHGTYVGLKWNSQVNTEQFSKPMNLFSEGGEVPGFAVMNYQFELNQLNN